MDIYTLVATYPTEFEAKLAESVLSEAGIATFLQVSDTFPPADYGSGMKLMVHPDNAAEATEILAAFKSQSGAQEGDSKDE